MNGRKHISAPAAARLAGVTATTIKAWCRDRGLAHYITPGGHWRVEEHSLAELMSRSGRREGFRELEFMSLPPLTRRCGKHEIRMVG